MSQEPSMEIAHILLELMNDPGLHRKLIFDTIALNPDLTARNRRNETPLLMAAAMGESDIIKALLDIGADPDDCMPNGNTPLIAAIIMGDSMSAQTLMQGGANPHAKNNLGHDAFDFAELYDQYHIGKMMTREMQKLAEKRRIEAARAAFNENAANGLPLQTPVPISKPLVPKGRPPHEQ